MRRTLTALFIVTGLAATLIWWHNREPQAITTGEGHAEYTPIGHTTNLASRMQALAPNGSIAATDATCRLCEGYFTFKALGPTKVRGVAEPVAVNEVTGLGPLRTARWRR
jgi:class 3 adenylate cyclase